MLKKRNFSMKKLILAALLMVAVIGTVFAQSYYTGDGGRGMRITVLPPEGKGLGASENWLSAFVQGILIDNLKKYSAITVIDRQNMDKILEKYILSGTILKTANIYSLQLIISDTETTERRASYSATTIAERLWNGAVVNDAAIALLSQLGVTLTAMGKAALGAVYSSQSIAAKTALAKGITAQKNGITVPPLAYYYQAASLDPTLMEATSRASLISTAITSGAIGENTRNTWKKLLDEAEIFFKTNLPFEIVYDPILTKDTIGDSKTVDLSFELTIKPSDGFKVLENLRQGLIETRKINDWGYQYWPLIGSSIFENGQIWSHDNTWSATAEKKFTIITELINNGRQIAKSSDTISLDIDFPLIAEKAGYGNHWVMDATHFHCDNKKVRISFKSVNVNDITDNLTIRIVSINGVNAQETGYIRISVQHNNGVGK
jgi:hypothetical protein